jgi:hypothetical protein
MIDWIPSQSVMSEANELLLRVLREYKKERAYHEAVLSVLGVLVHAGHRKVAEEFGRSIELSLPSCSDDLDVRYRDIESQVVSSRSVLDNLRSFAERLK